MDVTKVALVTGAGKCSITRLYLQAHSDQQAALAWHLLNTSSVEATKLVYAMLTKKRDLHMPPSLAQMLILYAPTLRATKINWRRFGKFGTNGDD